MAVSLVDLHKSFGRAAAVCGVSLDVHEGEFFVLLGPSGCGKTTILRLIAGLELCDSGQVFIKGRDVTEQPPKFRDLAMVFQSYALYPHKTVAENIGFPLRLRGVARGARDEAVRAAAAQVRLDALLERYPRQLSGGQRQRVALARAIVRRPAAFLMDEPLSNLDAKLRIHMRAELKRLQNKIGATTVYVTHDQTEAMTLADRVAVIDSGEISQVGTPREIYNHPRTLFVADFVGTPPMNQLAGVIRDGHFAAPGIALAAAGVADCPHAVLGVRPEDLVLAPPQQADCNGEIYEAELVGDYVLVTCRVGEQLLCTRADKDSPVARGDAAGLCFNHGNLHWFDGASGRRLG